MKLLKQSIRYLELSMHNLEIGPGDSGGLYGFYTLNIVAPATYVCAWGKALPISDNTYDLVYSSHCIEHVPWYNVKMALSEVYRILVPGGRFEVHTVNFQYIVQCYLDRVRGDGWTCNDKISDAMEWVSGRVFAYEKGPENWHKSLFDYSYLCGLLEKAGFKDVGHGESPRGQDHGAINLSIKGMKL